MVDLHLFTTSILICSCYSASIFLLGRGALFVLLSCCFVWPIIETLVKQCVLAQPVKCVFSSQYLETVPVTCNKTSVSNTQEDNTLSPRDITVHGNNFMAF